MGEAQAFAALRSVLGALYLKGSFHVSAYPCLAMVTLHW